MADLNKISRFIPSKKTMIHLFFGVIVVSMVYSPFFLSFSLFAFGTLAVFKWKNEKGQFSLMPDFKRFRTLFPLRRHLPMLSFSLLFLIVVWPGWPVEDLDFWFDRLRIKAPFLLAPIAFILLPPITRRTYLGVLYFLLIVLFLTCIGVTINYLSHFEEINELLKQGRNIPVPRHHIRFSILIALGIIAGIYLYQQGFFLFRKWEKTLIAGMTLFLFVFIHILSVRSGMVALYFALFVLVVRYILAERRFRMGMLLLAALVAAPLIAYRLVPSFQAKVAYMRYDWYMYRHGQGGINSDSGRFASLDAGLSIATDHLLMGVGAANLRKAVREHVTDLYPGFEVHMPANQFLYVLAGTGLIGLALFVTGFFYPLFAQKNYQDLFFLGLYAILLSSMMTDHSMEASMSVGMACFWLFLSLKYFAGRSVEGT